MIFPRMYLPDLATEDPWYEDWEIDQARRAAVPGVRGSPQTGRWGKKGQLDTLQGTNISPQKWHFEDDFPFPKVRYVNPLEGNIQARKTSGSAKVLNLIYSDYLTFKLR